MTDAPATNELLAERAKLIAANEAATGWGAAVGARVERIIEIDRQLRAAATPSAQGAGLLPDASHGKSTTIVTCCITGAIPGDGGACGDCDPCLMGEVSVPEPVKRLIAEKNSLLQRIGELEDAVAASPGNGAEKLARCGEPVAIKPLEWRDHRPDSFPEPAWSAQTPFGYYNIEEVSASDSPAYVVRLHNHHFIADKDSLEDAKAGAQADYERRIRSALVDSAALHSTSAAGETTSSDDPNSILRAIWNDIEFAAVEAPTDDYQSDDIRPETLARLANYLDARGWKDKANAVHRQPNVDTPSDDRGPAVASEPVRRSGAADLSQSVDHRPSEAIPSPQVRAEGGRDEPVCQFCKRQLAVTSIMGTAGLCCECVPGGFPLYTHQASPPDVEAIRADERERCARVAEEYIDGWGNIPEYIASAIRTGGQKK